MSKLTSGKDTLHVKAYQEITNNTICLRPERGEKISEDEPAKYLEIRTLVRKSLLILENEELVECDHRLGVAVTEANYKRIWGISSTRKALGVFAVPFAAHWLMVS